LLDTEFLLDQDRLAVGRVESSGEGARDVRGLINTNAPVPAMCTIQVERAPAKFVEPVRDRADVART
jgi:hypothetical protein